MDLVLARLPLKAISSGSSSCSEHIGKAQKELEHLRNHSKCKVYPEWATCVGNQNVSQILYKISPPSSVFINSL